MLGKNISIILGPHLLEFAQRQVRDVRYDSISDVVRAGLRLLEEREAALDAIRKALEEGEASGPAVPFYFDQFLAEMRRSVAPLD